jgi:sugar lactone lactonase YvrE
MRPILGVLLAAVAASAQNFGSVSLPSSLAEPGTQVEAVLNRDPQTDEYLGFCEGPAVDAGGTLFFSNSGRILKATPDGKGSIFDAAAAGTNGLEFDAQGLLVSGQNGKIVRYASDGKKETWIPDAAGTALGSINDLSLASTGSILFTNFTGGRVFFRPASGPLQNFNIGNKPNGIEWIEEKKFAYLNLTGLGKVVKFPFDPASGTSLAAALGAATDFATGVDGPDGITVDDQGNVYVAANQQGTINVYSPEGSPLGKITVKSANPAHTAVTYNTTNCVFGDHALYIAGDAGAYKVRLKVGGRKRPGSTRVFAPAPITFKLRRIGACPRWAVPFLDGEGIPRLRDAGGRAL